MALNILIIGGSGEISACCVDELVQLGHQVTVFNRGRRELQVAPVGKAGLNAKAGPNGNAGQVRQIVGDVDDAESYAQLAGKDFDVICQFLAFEVDDVERDIDLFRDRCAQYIFVSSASCYEKPWISGVITEDTPLNNPFMLYSRNKAACEKVLEEAQAQGKLPVTVVRPSHTYRERLPSTVIDGTHLAWRIQAGKPVIVHGDGQSLWTLTRSEDFARAFASLCGNKATLAQSYHITDSQAHTWNTIVQTIADLAGCDVDICHVTPDTLVDYHHNWRGPLLGDKANSVVFDNSKIAQVTGGWQCEISLRDGLAKSLTCAQQQLSHGYHPPSQTDALIDRIITEQGNLRG